MTLPATEAEAAFAPPQPKAEKKPQEGTHTSIKADPKEERRQRRRLRHNRRSVFGRKLKQEAASLREPFLFVVAREVPRRREPFPSPGTPPLHRKAPGTPFIPPQWLALGSRKATRTVQNGPSSIPLPRRARVHQGRLAVAVRSI